MSARVHLHPPPLYFMSWPVESVKLFLSKGSSGAVLSIYVPPNTQHAGGAARRVGERQHEPES